MECNKCKECTICDEHKDDDCGACIKCDTCKQRKECKAKICSKCQKCTCDQCRRCKRCKHCTLCNKCKNCPDCKQCFSCKLRNKFKLCKKCMEERENRKKNIIAIYGFSVTVLIAIPLLLVLHYGSDYILLVTDIHEDPLKLLLALVVIVGVPYYLILLWDSGNDNNEGKDNKLIVKFKDSSWRLVVENENDQLPIGSQLIVNHQ
uniref:TNFR-Cys domain-containing protein n=1 Tax=Amphimedon queenslandica TaxID=400682 RepID=A0A1X7UMT5_AMPQE